MCELLNMITVSGISILYSTIIPILLLFFSFCDKEAYLFLKKRYWSCDVL